MNAVIEDIERSGETELPDGSRIRIHSQIGPGSGRVIRNAVQIAKPRLACEVGLAFGMSTLYILDAMEAAGGERLIGMDPAQHDPTWRGGGLHNVHRAGFAGRFEFHEESSHVVLPRLVVAGTRIQFAFIDGWHTFDHTLVDFFYIDQMLDAGGVVVLDDVGYPSIRRLCHFIVTNRDYEAIDAELLPAQGVWQRAAKSLLQRALHPLVRDNFTPDARARELEAQVNRAQLIALRKRRDDRRSFDHFVAF